eukprot:scaffold2424_cov122-Isochrysis_galbana.AAC.1
MAAPGWFHQALQADVYQLLWEREPTFEAEHFGTDSNSYKWIKNHTAPITPKGGASLGIGLLDWNSNVKAMQVKWLLKYLDASVSTWKFILDCWFARSSLGRAAILSSIQAKVLTKSMRGNIALPPFWSQALNALHELPLVQTSLSRDGALSQPIWDNRHYPPPKIPPRLRDRWESLQVTVVHNTFSDREGTRHFTREENQSYIDTDSDHPYFQNKKINNERFLASWDEMTHHCDTTMATFPPTKTKKPTPPVRGDPELIQITTD